MSNLAICAICDSGCQCRGDNPTAGCEHYACWGPKATSDCPDVPAARTAACRRYGIPAKN
jgi:hypothetical protein